MPKTKRNSKFSNNKTKKICPIGLQPFEAELTKKMPHSQLIQTSKERTKLYIKQLLSKFAPKNIKPNNDYYDYINYDWLKEVKLKKNQEYIVQIDDFRLTQDKVYKELDNIIVDYIKTHKDKLSKNLYHFRRSVLKKNPINYSRNLCKEAEKLVDKFISEKNPWSLLGYINSNEMIADSAPFIWSQSQDEKDSKIFCSHISSHSFALLDLSVYFDDGTEVEYKKKYRKAFNDYNRELFKTTLGKHNYNTDDIFDVEVEMINAFVCKGVKDSDKTYNKVYKDEALSKYGFDWAEFAKGMGYKTVPNYFVSTNLSYLKCCSEIMTKNWATPKWRTYWVWILIQNISRLTHDWSYSQYKFYANFQRGQERNITNEAVHISLFLSIPFNTFLTNQYVAKYEDPRLMEYTKILCNDLKIVFNRILERNTWMAPSTKAYALKKMKHFNFVFGKPDKLCEDPDLVYNDYLYDNMKKVYDFRHNKFIELEGQPIIDMPLMDWTQYPVKMIGTQAYIVNASYTPAKNSIYINLGYIQKPFVDLDARGIEYNLANLGDTISHEMSHGFDDTGSQYGWDGNLYDWWTPEDKKKYKEKQNDVIKQYEKFAARDGIKFDASIGIGEDLADISAVAICTEYLREFQKHDKDIIPISVLSSKTYFAYYAYQQRQKVGKKALIAQLKTNPHPLDKYRCNVPLSRSELFRALYNVKKGDGMWWHNTDSIW